MNAGTSDIARYDVLIIGGGPAGATCATVLADHSRRVLVLERDRFPRHHIGESLMPQTYWTFKRIGMLEALAASDFPRKESVQFVSSTGKDSMPYFFTDRDPHEWSVTWQVPRDRFDAMMIDNARRHGAEVRHGVRVSEVIFEGERAVGVRAVENGQPVEFRATVVVDATGVAALLSKQLKSRVGDPNLRNAAIYAYFKNARRDAGRNAGATLVIRTPGREGWFWFIPLPDEITSIGVVGSPSFLMTGRGDDPLATLEHEIARCDGLARRLTHAVRVSGAYVISDYTYRATRMAGDGWVLIGDAFGFIDPLYSSGVLLALKSGEWAADAIHEALRDGDTSAARLGRYEARFVQGMTFLRQLVYAYYDEAFSFGQFMRAHPEYKDNLVRLLIGDVFNDEVGAIFDAMREWNSEAVSVTERMASAL